MQTIERILVFHPGAIGDVMLATPVASALKNAFPTAHLTYATHKSLHELLRLTRTIDEVISYDKRSGLVEQRESLLATRPQLIVDLAGTLKSHLLTAFSGAKVVHYKKHPSSARPIKHAVENFLEPLKALGLKIQGPKFPTVYPTAELMSTVHTRFKKSDSQKMVGLVPGVGKFRSHRAWLPERWIQLASQLVRSEQYVPVLIGGPDEADLCNDIAEQSQAANASGVLTLSETAALLKLCDVVISGDTGPAHVAVAVGTPVVGLYGPTFFERSGPFGCENLSLQKSDHCSCRDLKICKITGTSGSGDCMRLITLEDVTQKLSLATSG